MRLTRVLLNSYFKRYIERELRENTLRQQWHPLTGWKTMKNKEEWHYREHRPWTTAFKQDNESRTKRRPVYVEPIKEWKIFKGDRVEILVGKDTGKQGIVNCIIKERNWCFIDGLNCEHKVEDTMPGAPPVHTSDERPLLVTTQVKLVDPEDEEATDVEWRWTEEGDRVRVSLRTGRIIQLPREADEAEDGALAATYSETDKDTKEKVLTKVTFKPKLATFETDIMEAMGIKEDRVPAKTYWY